ncbi:MAG: hypothetical protein FWC58_10240 [Desulfobulbus sp.]|nr:hypothetical protein [Desulfobulbus sp.]
MGRIMRDMRQFSAVAPLRQFAAIRFPKRRFMLFRDILAYPATIQESSE